MGHDRAIIPALALLLVSCGGGGGSSGGGNTPTPTPAPAPTPTPTPTPTQATVSYLHVFSIDENDGAQPRGPLLQASDGNFYGVTSAGGTHTCRGADQFPCGTVFKITPGGTETVLYSFGASATDGFTPTAPLVQGTDGALYGLTSNGGAYGNGTVFRITLSGNYSVLYSFGANSTDGLVPVGGLIQASDGSFYGVTSSGGSHHCDNIPQGGNNCGTVFKITASGTKTTLYSFGASAADGSIPNGPLLQGSDGNFYGTTSYGGANTCGSTTNSCGAVFKMTSAGAVTILHSFGATSADGSGPQGPLIRGNDGALYGTTASGGGGSCGWSYGCGTVFRITTAGAESVLYSFAPSSRLTGFGPSPFLLLAKDGAFYGTTTSGGQYQGDGDGTIFRLTSSGTHTVLYSFGPNGQNPSSPEGGLIQATDNAFYGITFYNGTLGASGARGGFGTVFKATVN